MYVCIYINLKTNVMNHNCELYYFNITFIA